MQLQVFTQPSTEQLEWIHQRLVEFNAAHFEVKQRPALAVMVEDKQGQPQGGISAKTFGRWLMIDYLWLHPDLRGQGWGEQMLSALEQQAIQRGCQMAWVDTLAFQALGFYQKQGYQVDTVLEDYPLTGKRYYLRKVLQPDSLYCEPL